MKYELICYSLGVLLHGWVVHQVGKLLGHLHPQLLKVFADFGEIGLLCKASCGRGGAEMVDLAAEK